MLEPEGTREFTRRGGMELVQELLRISEKRSRRASEETGERSEILKSIKARARNPTTGSYTRPSPTLKQYVLPGMITVFVSHDIYSNTVSTAYNCARAFQKTLNTILVLNDPFPP